MHEIVILAVCGINLALMAGWMTVGALENLFHPSLNEPYTAEVMDMRIMREEYPDAYVHVAYRRLNNPKLRRGIFYVIVAFELLAMSLLWTGAGAVGLAVLGQTDISLALSLGLIGVCAFTAVWSGFLVVGNYFCYWFGYEGAQNTHFQMLHWGLLSTVILIAAISVLL